VDELRSADWLDQKSAFQAHLGNNMNPLDAQVPILDVSSRANDLWRSTPRSQREVHSSRSVVMTWVNQAVISEVLAFQ